MDNINNKQQEGKQHRVFVNPVRRQPQPNLGDTNPGGNPLISLVQSLTANSSFTTYHLATILMSFYLGTPRYEFPTHSLISTVQPALLLRQTLWWRHSPKY
ncbi:hypothetical protein QL285_056667 [Trifolium repens]|nr:hypothetical protein QL285_056667 [Trifolium repens]